MMDRLGPLLLVPLGTGEAPGIRTGPVGTDGPPSSLLGAAWGCCERPARSRLGGWFSSASVSPLQTTLFDWQVITMSMTANLA